MSWQTLAEAVARLEAGAPPPADAGIFGASLRPQDCRLVLIPVPWDATVSYGDGTADGPSAMLAASHQLDLEDAAFVQPYRAGITMLPEDERVRTLNRLARGEAKRVIAGDGDEAALQAALATVNDASRAVNARVEAMAVEQLGAQLGERLVGVVGGDHSSPYGLIKALADRSRDGFGILHLDAHLDLRRAYEGFRHSHASIMHNVMEDCPAVANLIQVGVRDYSAEEHDYQRNLRGGSRLFTSRDLFRRKARGTAWGDTVADILAALPRDVYVSFDIDGLDPSLCPSTGTPVPGGLSFEEATFLIEELVATGRRIIGFDLCEVAPGADGDEWDANVGARILYKLCGAALASWGVCRRI